MLLTISGVLDRAQATAMRQRLEASDWVDGNATSGHQSALAKRNRQLDEDDPAARELGGQVLDALARNAPFVAAALPLKVYPPLFNRYDEGGDRFGPHVDGSIRIRRGSDFRIRSDLSATLFLSDPADYDGGELAVEGQAPIRLGPGDMLLYPATTVHEVLPVTRGTRFASFFWIQSMVRDAGQRDLLQQLDSGIQALGPEVGAGAPGLVRLTGVYHNLLRRWAEL